MANASLTYEILMYLNSFYFGLFAASELGIGVLKVINLEYAENKFLQEASVLIGLCVIETIRIVLGRKGSLSDRGWPVIASVVLTFPCAAGVASFMLMQAHIVKLEYIICALMLALQVTEILYSIIFIFSICRPTQIT